MNPFNFLIAFINVALLSNMGKDQCVSVIAGYILALIISGAIGVYHELKEQAKTTYCHLLLLAFTLGSSIFI